MRRPTCWIIGLWALAPACLLAGDVIDPGKAQADSKDALLWYDARLPGIEGQGWSETKAPFDRLPAKAERVVRPAVWGLSRDSAGLASRFVTDAHEIHARWTLISDRLAMPHMPATGVSGVDLYVRQDDGTWHWLAVGQPHEKANTARLVGGLPAGKREYLLYFPLYNGVSTIEIGIPKDASLEKAPARVEAHRKPVVFYGTSITQGGCASRPGMVHTAILGRKWDRPVINLGFSGNGTMDPEMAELLGELDAAVYVIDCLPNMNAEQVAERVVPLVKIIRKARPETPIVLAEDRTYSNAFLIEGSRNRQAASRKALREGIAKLRSEGVSGLYELPGMTQLSADGEGTVDGSHPTDLGFADMADAFGKVIDPLLEPETAIGN